MAIEISALGTPLSATYDLRLVILSLVIAIISSYTALDMAGQVAVAQGLARKLWLSGSAIALGMSIWVMHFIAMLAYQLPISVSYTVSSVLLSIVVAIALSGIGLLLATQQPLSWLQLIGSSIFVGLATIGMHFTAMMGMQLAAVPVYDLKLVVLADILTIILSFGALWLVFHHSAKNLPPYENVWKCTSALLAGMAIDVLHYLAMAAATFYPSIKLLKPPSSGMSKPVLAIATGTAGLTILILTALASFFGQRLSAEIARSQALKESEERYQNLYDFTPDVYFSLTADGTVQSINQVGAEFLGYNKAELVNSPLLNLVYEEDRDWVQQWITKIFAEKLATSEMELRKVRKDGSVIWERQRNQLLFDDCGIPTELRIICRDITERKQAEKQLWQNAFHDALTGLPNRALFIDRLGQALEYKKRHQDYLFAVLFLDLDRFKVINDSLGHLIGDQLLIVIANTLKSYLRPTDTVARLGGDEFVILLVNIENASDAIHIANRIEQELSSPFQLNNKEVFTSASIGIALSATGYEHPEALLRDADIAMYQAKNQGAGCYQIFNPEMYTTAVARLQLETDLRNAFERQEFFLQYQPIVSLKTGKIVAFEALIRWQHPQSGIQNPAEFLSAAEETGLITRLCQWVLPTACYQLRQWQLQLPETQLVISVNLSGKQFTQANIIEQIDSVLQETGLEPANLRLEIIEGVIMEDSESTLVKLIQLKELGVQLAIDDFGTGYSSLSRLHYFPINGLKIDRSFVSGIGFAQASLDIVETIVTLAHKLGVDVTAEGVETPEQLAYLRTLLCEYGQGYLFSKPLDSEAAVALLRANPQW